MWVLKSEVIINTGETYYRIREKMMPLPLKGSSSEIDTS